MTDQTSAPIVPRDDKTSAQTMEHSIRGTIKWAKAMGHPAPTTAELILLNGVGRWPMSHAFEVQAFIVAAQRLVVEGKESSLSIPHVDNRSTTSILDPDEAAIDYVLHYVIHLPPGLPTDRLVGVHLASGRTWREGPNTPQGSHPVFVPAPDTPVWVTQKAPPPPGTVAADYADVHLDPPRGWGFANFVLTFR